MKPIVAVVVLLALSLSGCALFKGRPASVAATSEPWYPLATCANPHPDDIPAP